MRRALILATVLLAAAPAGAHAHAQLESTAPERGAVLKTQPEQVVLRFSEAVEGAFGAVRVFDARARRVDDGRVVHPDGATSALAVGLRPGLPPGSYTATFRVISADGHPVAGGLVFSVGRAGAAPSQTVDELLDSSRAGPVTRAAQRVVHALQYLATALAVGLLAFWLWCLPAAVRGSTAPRLRRLLLGAAGLGLATSVLGVALEGAIAGGTTLWSALDATTIGDVLSTRFGEVWGLRALVWVALLGVVLAGRVGRVAVGLSALLVVAPALEGHSATIGPTALLVPADVVHVAAMAAWLGGLVALLLLLPRAERPPSAVVDRFSTVALVAVAALAVTGTIASIAFLTSVEQLWDTGYGRELLAKIGLLAVLIGLGAANRRHLRRVLVRREVVLLLVVLGISGVLVDGVPPVSATPGPYSASTRMGPLDLEVTVDPARRGPNAMHLYLFTARTGAPFDGTKELTATASLRDERIGPLPITLRRSGLGHYTADTLHLAPAGRWTVEITDRVSAFDQYSATLIVPIR